VEDEVTGDEHGVRLGLGHVGQHGLQGGRVAMDIGQRSDAAHASAPTGGMMKLSRPEQATSPSTVATPRPLPKRDPSFSIVTSRRSVSPGATMRLNRTSSMPANSPIRSPKPGCLAT